MSRAGPETHPRQQTRIQQCVRAGAAVMKYDIYAPAVPALTVLTVIVIAFTASGRGGVMFDDGSSEVRHRATGPQQFMNFAGEIIATRPPSTPSNRASFFGVWYLFQLLRERGGRG